jgi:hypothetical protein
MSDTNYKTKQSQKDPRKQEQMWEARQHPKDLILPDVHPTRFPGTWVAIFDETLPKDQVNALRLEGYSLYKHIVACPNRKIQVTIREDTGTLDEEHIEQRYEQYEHTYK